jgi:dolichol-phosphate mannosyltransferase
MDLSIILPTYNEKNNINILVKNILKILNDLDNKEIIVVDDNSSDGTYLYCKKEFEKNNQIKLILRKNNRGLANSIGEGIKASKGKNIIVMDTDLSHDPKLIPQIINLNKDYDIVSCSRYCEGGSMGNKLHYYCSFSYNLLLKFILKTQIKDNTGGYFCIKRNTLDLLPFEKIFYGYGEYFFRLLYFANKKKKSIIEIPTIYNRRIYGRSKSNFSLLLFKYFFSAIKLRLMSRK